jgi:hypothetical protein
MIINSMRLFLFLLCGLFGLGLNAQTNSNSSTIVANKFDFSFIDFLISNAEFEDALLLLRNASNQIAGTDEALNDSLNYYKGIAYYNIKQCPPLNWITLGQIKSDNINRINRINRRHNFNFSKGYSYKCDKFSIIWALMHLWTLRPM